MADKLHVTKKQVAKDIIAHIWKSEPNREEIRSICYLLKGDKNILIDAGLLIKDKVDILVLTHIHIDHILYANKYRERGVKIAIGSRDSTDLETKGPTVLAYLCEYGKPSACKVDLKLKEGDIIKNSNFTLKVIETPGHSPGSIALYEENKKILFTGDTWFGRNITGSPKYEGGNKKELTDSVAKLKSLNVEILCPGHWKSFWPTKDIKEWSWHEKN